MLFPVGQHSALFSSSFFLIGGLIAIYYPKLLFVNVNSIVSLFACFAFVLVNIGFVIFNAFDYARARTFFLLLDIVLFWIAVRGVKRLGSLNESPWFFRISFFVFCIHGIVLESLEKIILIVIGKNIIGAYVDYIFAPVITLVIICLIAKFLRKHAFPAWNILSGGRV